ncbi:MAG: stage 0 sporulation family protein [Chloroflexota bacterium]|nr:stage 0 sporulation family protein [Chloroflexota bacterium]
MPIVCGVKFRGTHKSYYFSPGDVEDIEKGEYVIVETSRGKEMGEVVMAPKKVDQSEVVGELKPVLSRAAPADRIEAQRLQMQEPEVVEKCGDQVDELGLKMKIIDAQYSYDGSRLTFFFTADERVDFRELVRKLAHVFRTRIELRQVGVRDEAKIMEGLGPCGRPLCCATWLKDFSPISIRMAKEQDLPLDPMEISGLCGRLRCCLRFEYERYCEVKGKFPKEGAEIETEMGKGRITKINVLTETARVSFENGTKLDLTLGQLRGEEPIGILLDDKER